jgi:hypothetical protein
MVISALYPRRTIKDELAECKRVSGAGMEGFDAALTNGMRVLYRVALDHGQLQAGEVQADAEVLVLAPAPDGSRRGIALGCRQMQIGRKKIAIPSADFEFTLSAPKHSAFSIQRSAFSFTPIYRPMDRVEIEPKADRFAVPIEIRMSSSETNAEIHYTLDGTDPVVPSPLYTGPFLLERTATIKARAFRKGLSVTPPTASGTHMSALTRAVYTKEDPREPLARSSAQTPGLNCDYYEEGACTLSAYVLDFLTPTNQHMVKELFDISAKKTTNSVYAFRYTGYLDIPADGVYSFHAPEEFVFPHYDCAYDLRLFLNNEEWYPTMRWHNYGVWSVPLKKGKHALKVIWVDQRAQDWYLGGDWRADWRRRLWDGEKPMIQISGPGLEKQPIPAKMLYPY